MDNTSVKKNVVFNLVKNISSLVFPLLTFSYAARVLNPEVMGKVTYARTLANYFIVIAMLGVNLYGVREVAKVRNVKAELTKTVQEICSINIVMMMVMLSLYLLLTFSIGAFSDRRNILLVFAVLLFIKPIGMDWLFGGLEEYTYIAKRTVFVQVLSLIIMILVVKTPEDAIFYAMILVVSESGANIFNLFRSRKFLEHKKAPKLEIRKHIKPMLFFFGTVISSQIYSDIDSLMLGTFVGDRVVGLYSAATKLCGAIFNVLVSVCVVVYARVTYYRSFDEKKSLELTEKTFNYLMIFAIPVTVGLELLSKETILLFCGKEYLAAAVTSQIIVPQILIYAIIAFLEYLVLNPLGKEKLVFIATCVGAVCNVIGNMVLIPQFEERGAAIATVATKFIMLILCLVVTRKWCDYKSLIQYIWQYILGVLIIIVICQGMKFIVSNMYLRCGMSIICSACAYFVFLILLRNPFIMEGILQVMNRLRVFKKDK